MKDSEIERIMHDVAHDVIKAAIDRLLPSNCGQDIAKIQLQIEAEFVKPAPTPHDGDPASTGAMLAAMVLYAWGYRPQ